MPTLTTQQKVRLAAAATVLAAIASITYFVGGSPADRHTQATYGALEDAGFKHAGQGGDMTDLDSAEVQAGEIAKSVVNLMPGQTQAEVVPANGWAVQSVTQEGTLVTVVVKNNTGRHARFQGWLRFNQAPGDAGVD